MKLQHSDWRVNLVKDCFWKINFPPMRDLKFLADHVTFKLSGVLTENLPNLKKLISRSNDGSKKVLCWLKVS